MTNVHGTICTMDKQSYALGYVQAMADSDGSIHSIGKGAKGQVWLAITFRQGDNGVLDVLSEQLDVLGIEHKRYVQKVKRGTDMHMVRIHKRAEVRRFIDEIGFRHKDRAWTAAQYPQ